MRYEILLYPGRRKAADRFAFEAPSDLEALGAAMDLPGVTARELWRGGRRIWSSVAQLALLQP